MKPWNVNQKIRQFNSFLDEFIMEIAKPFAMIGLVFGTVELFLRGSLTTSMWFSVPWAVVQALTIDGLFFAVWFKLFNAKWTKTTWPANVGLALIGLVLSVVVGLTNGIISLQQLWNLADSQDAMVRLGISPVDFTVGRAILMVATLVMLAFTYNQKSTNGSDQKTTDEPNGKMVAPVDHVDRTTQTMNAPTGVVVVPMDQMDQTTQTTVRTTEPMDKPLLALDQPRHTKDEVMVLLVQTKLESGSINVKELATKTGVPITTLRRWSREVGSLVVPLPAPNQMSEEEE